MAFALFLNRNVDGDRLGVFTQQGARDRGNPLRGIANGPGLFSGFGRRPHEPFEAHHAGPTLGYVIDRRDGEHLLADHAIDPFDTSS